MNKRPLLLMFVCFVLGEVGIYPEVQWGIGISAAGAVLLGIWYAHTNGIDLVLLLLVFFYLLGMRCCYDAKQPGALEDVCRAGNCDVTLTAQVDGVERNSLGYRIYLNQVYLDGNYQGWIEKRILVNSEQIDCKLGQRVKCVGTLKLLEHARNPGGFDAYCYYQCRNVGYQLEVAEWRVVDNHYWQFREVLRLFREELANCFQKLVNPAEAGFLEAIVLGEKADLDKDIKKQYQQAGIAHVIAISGLHIGFLGMSLFGILRKCQLPYWAAAVLSGSLVLLYGIFTGMSASCERAVIMLLVSFLGKVIGRAYDLLSAMALAGIVILINAPLQFLDAGFLLSFGAIIGIGAIYPCLVKMHFPKEGKWLTRFRQNFLISVSVQLATLPIICYFYYEVPVYGVFLNLIVIPLMSFVVPSAMLGAMLSYINEELAHLVLLPAISILKWNQWLSGWSNNLPFAHWVTGQLKLWQFVLYVLVLIIVLWSLNKHCFPVLLVTGILGIIGMLSFPDRNLRITMLDVGQGDGLVLQMPDSQVILIDGGSSSKQKLYEYTYEPYLKSQGITSIDYVIVSHGDIDHIKAIQELMEEGYPIRNLVLPHIIQPDDNYQQLYHMALQRKIPVTFISRGKKITGGDWTLTCLHPTMDYSGARANVYSTTLALRYEAFSMLFTGDLEGEGEEMVWEYLKQGKNSPYTVLKVAHHGSKNSTNEEFLRQVSPKYAIISAGENNSYGHPHQIVLKRLKKQGAKVYCTKEQGAVLVETDGNRIKIQGYLSR